MSFRRTLVYLGFAFVTGLGIFTTNSFARDLVDLSLDISTTHAGDEAKQEAFDQATEQASQKLTEEILGPERTAHFWPGLRSKLLKNSTRFVLFIKGSPPQETGGVTHIQVTLRISPDNLENLLREEGVLNAANVKVLPLMEILDSKSPSYVWWTSPEEDVKSPLAQDIFKKFISQLAGKFKAKSVYVLDPTGASFRMSVPAAYRSENLKREDQMLFAQYLKADAVLSGRVQVVRVPGGDSKVVYDLQLWQSKSGREMANIQRTEALVSDAPRVALSVLDQTNPKVMDELVKKMAEALAAGSLNLNVVKISVTGLEGYRSFAEFKRQLTQLREIKVLKERLFDSNRVVFEAETSASPGDLAKAVQKSSLGRFTTSATVEPDDGLALTVKGIVQ